VVYLLSGVESRAKNSNAAHEHTEHREHNEFILVSGLQRVKPYVKLLV
jgi:hypothetical protein